MIALYIAARGQEAIRAFSPALLLLVAASLACGNTSKGDNDPATKVDTTSWTRIADSVMEAHLARSLFLSSDGPAPNMRECAGDDGADNPPTAIAAARARIIGRDTVSVDWAYDYQGEDTITQRTTQYTVEVTSAAVMVPNWISQVEYRNDTIFGDEAYVMNVGPSVDTVRITLEDLTRLTPRWAVCAPVRVGVEPGYSFWAFVEHTRPWPKAIQWNPPDASWNRIRALADSLK